MGAKSTACTFTEAQCREFADSANPHQWLLSADNFHSQAVELYQRRGGGRLVHRRPGHPAVIRDDTNRATFLLCAFALENAIKAFLVYEHPEWVANGHLSKAICSHRLVELSEKSTLIPHRKRDRWVLAAFEDGNESWMRYPCGRRADDLQPEPDFHSRQWQGYVRVMRGYGQKLMRLLGKGWRGPYGWHGTWEMQGDWLGADSPPTLKALAPSRSHIRSS